MSMANEVLRKIIIIFIINLVTVKMRHMSDYFYTQHCNVGRIESKSLTFDCITQQPFLNIQKLALSLSQISTSQVSHLAFTSSIWPTSDPSRFQIRIQINQYYSKYHLKLGYYMILIKHSNHNQYIDLIQLNFLQIYQNMFNQQLKSHLTETVIRVNIKQKTIFNQIQQQLIYMPLLASFYVQSRTNESFMDELNPHIGIDIKIQKQKHSLVKFSLYSIGIKIDNLKAFCLIMRNQFEFEFIKQNNKLSNHLSTASQMNLANHKSKASIKQTIFFNKHYTIKNTQIFYDRIVEKQNYQYSCFYGLEKMIIFFDNSFSLKIQKNQNSYQKEQILIYNGSKRNMIHFKRICIRTPRQQQKIQKHQKREKQNNDIKQKNLLNQYQNGKDYNFFIEDSQKQNNRFLLDTSSIIDPPIVGTDANCTMYGKYWNPATNTCDLCSAKWSFCSDCTINTCTSCLNPSYLQGTQGCYCNPNIYAYPNCTSCGPTPNICTSCDRGYFVEPINKTSCLACSNITNCTKCISQTECSDCDPNLVPDNITIPGLTICTLFQYFIPNCYNDYCYNMTYCGYCQTGCSVVQTATGNSSCLNCTVTIDHCLDCTSSIYCTGCRLGYFLGDTYLSGVLGIGRNCSLCSTAIANCSTCFDNVTCILCFPSFLWNATSGVCQCDPIFHGLINCTNCINSTHCTACISARFLTSTAQCIACTPTNIHPNCTACGNFSLCTSCQPSYVVEMLSNLYNSTCTLCKTLIPGCKALNCTNQYMCNQCQANYYIKEVFFFQQTCQFCNVSLGSPCLECLSNTYCLLIQKSIAVISLIFVIIVLIQFYIGSYTHKMIGLQTIHIIQLIYFIRMLGNQNSKLILGSLNSVRYSATGYQNSDLLIKNLFNIQFPSSKSLSKQFLAIQLKQYFLQNINFTLILLIIIYIIYIIQLIRKYLNRNKYINFLDLQYKDKFTQLKRSTQWIYDHFVFPYTIMINGIVFFNTIAYLKINNNENLNRKQISTQQNISYPFHISLLLISFGIYSYQIISSYQQFIKYKTPLKQRNKFPLSLIERIQHDQNNKDIANYHPFYVFIYLTLYNILWVVLTFGLFVQSFSMDFEVMVGFNLAYFVLIMKWKPYHQRVNAHNYFLLLNQGTIIIFLVICITFQTINKRNDQVFLISMYIVLFLLILVTLGGFIRIFYQQRFRKNFEQQSAPLYLCDTKKSDRLNIQLDQLLQIELKNHQKQQQIRLSKKSHLLTDKNTYLFENQLKQIKKNSKISNKLQIQIQQNKSTNNFFNDINKDNDNQFYIQKIRQQYARKNKQLIMMENQKMKELKKDSISQEE